MAEDKRVDGNESDPMAAFRELRDVYLGAWAKAMTQTVNSEAYAQATGAVLDACLTASAPFREVTEKAMMQTLQHLGLPSRAELAALAERFTNVEMRLDDVDARLDRIEKLLAKQFATGSGETPDLEKPPRGKRAK